MAKASKMMQMVNCRIRISLTDGRIILGQLLAYDKHMNLIVADCEEFRLTRKQKAKPEALKTSLGSAAGEMRRSLGLILLRGETIVSLIPESGAPPARGNKARVPAAKQMAPGMTMQGRMQPPMPGGMGIPPPGAPPMGLGGPVPGMYGPPPVPGMMPPSMYPPGMVPPQQPPYHYPLPPQQ